ncbi:MAG: succinate dehydrogenase assembly factor 2 [Novosphingobium sp.]|nr:succinate dehydrogenase assembly factor 2 [Novosphingobium sp.]
MSDPARLAKLRFRAWHRGTREMDYICGCFFDRFHGDWSEAQLAWFEMLLGEEDPDVMGWAMGTGEVPAHLAGEQMVSFQRLDYVNTSR